MSEYYGTGVGRHLSADEKQYTSVVFQQKKPPIAEEFNLLTDAMDKARRDILRANIPSGFVSDPFDPKADFQFDSKASNMFWLGKNGSDGADDIVYAVVNGWVVPIAGTMSTDLRSAIKLPPPPAATTSSDVNFVFLEVWKAQVSPDGDVNKPSEDEIYRFGNVEYGGANLTNQILDPRFQVETSERIQLQYRIRVVENVNPETAPYGFNSQIKAQGPRNVPISPFEYENMGDELGDSGLWRAGMPHETTSDGQYVASSVPMETSDGFVYAIPLCMVFRRASGIWNINNQTQAVDRNPSMTDRSGAKVLSTVQLTTDILATDMSIEVGTSQADTTFPDDGGFIRIGSEVIAYSSWTGTTITVSSDGRGAKNTHATGHETDADVLHVSGHPLNLFSDQVVADDILDLRHLVNISGFSYTDLLQHNFQKLIKGDLKTTWKESEGDLKGMRHFQVDQFSLAQPAGEGLIKRDAPDGFRKVFSDACALQPENLLVIPPTTQDVLTSDYTFNQEDASVHTDDGLDQWQKGDNVKIPLQSLNNTFDGLDKKVRFVHPFEYDNSPHDPVRVWFGDTYKDNTDVNKRTPLVAGGSQPDIVVLGKKPVLEPNPLPASLSFGVSSEINFSGDEILIASGSLDFSTVADDLADSDAWIVIDNSNYSGERGAFKIVDQGTNDSRALKVVNADGSSPSFGSTSETDCDWRILTEECSEEDDHLYIVFTEDQSDRTLYVSYDVLYHPNQGLSRVPEKALFARLENASATSYLRGDTFADLSSPTTTNLKDFPIAPMESFPHDRKKTHVRNNRDMRTNVESTWSEAYVDRGSKTFLFQPIQEVSFRADGVSNQSTMPYASGPGSHPEIAFQLEDTDACYFVPKELLPPPGRVDIPFSKENGPHPFGINACFQANTGSNGVNTEIVKDRILGIYDPDDTNPENDYGTTLDLATLGLGPGATGTALVCKIYDEGGVRGIELPAHFGISCLFGLYFRDDVFANGTASGSNVTNLLKTDLEARSLIITKDNTFVIPEDALDISLEDDDFSTLQFVFEFAGFMFEDWTEDFVRIHTLSGFPDDDIIIEMLVNGPCEANDVVSTVSTRIPYQGNITGTMPNNGSTSFEDYRFKNSVDSKSKIDSLLNPLDAREAVVNNPANLEILASMPFVTSLGTGRISGPVVAGSYTDVGYISQKGFPSEISGTRKACSKGLSSVIDSQGNELIQRPVPDALTGITERLPSGLLASDHLFLGEGFYGSHKHLWTDTGIEAGGYRDYQDNTPLSKTFLEGQVVLSDGTSDVGDATDYSNTKNLYRTYRGGTLTVASGDDPGGAFVLAGDRVYKEFPQIRSFESEYSDLIFDKSEMSTELAVGNITPTQYQDEIEGWNTKLEALKAKYKHLMQIHGAVMFGVAFLVRTRPETVSFGSDDYEFNHGNELQMLVTTGASFGTDEALDVLDSESASKEVLDLFIQLHPTGHGEGDCAADRYHIEGRPLQKPTKVTDGSDLDIYRGTKPTGIIGKTCD